MVDEKSKGIAPPRPTKVPAAIWPGVDCDAWAGPRRPGSCGARYPARSATFVPRKGAGHMPRPTPLRWSNCPHPLGAWTWIPTSGRFASTSSPPPEHRRRHRSSCCRGGPPARRCGKPTFPGLAKERTVYALDALGDAGMSVQTRKIENSADQAAWLDQVLAQLGSPKVHLVGHSFGGWSAANYAIRHPERVASLMLLEPVFVFGGLRWQVYVKSIPASVPFLPQSWRDAMLSDFGGVKEIDPNDPVARMISDATEHYAVKLPVPQRLSQNQLQRLPMPVYAAMAADS